MNSREQGSGWKKQVELWSLTNLEPAFVWIPPEAEPERGRDSGASSVSGRRLQEMQVGVWGCKKGKVDNRGYIFKSVTIEGN